MNASNPARLGILLLLAFAAALFWYLLLPSVVLSLIFVGIFRINAWWRSRNGLVPLTEPGTELGPVTLGRDAVAFDPRSLETFQSTARRPVAVLGIALVIIGIGLQTGFQRWYATRTLTPVNIPISLAPGQTTKTFNVNLTGTYHVNIHLDCDPNGYYSWPKGNCHRDSLQTRFVLYGDGKRLGGGSTESLWDDLYVETSGYYKIDLDVLSDMRCLDARHPRLVIFVARDFETWKLCISWLTFLLILIGSGSLLFPAAIQVCTLTAKSSGAASHRNISSEYSPTIAKPLPKLISGLPSFGVTYTVIASVAVFFVVGYNHFPSRGLRIHLIAQPPGNVDTWTKPLVVYVRSQGWNVEPKFYVNSKLVPWNQLGEAIKEELSRRSEWVVYVQVDPDLPWEVAAEVIDIAKSLPAKTVLLTPQTEMK